MTSPEVAAKYLFEDLFRAAERLVAEIERGELDNELLKDLDQQSLSQNRRVRIANEVRKMSAGMLDRLAAKAKVDYALGKLEIREVPKA